MVRKHKGIHQIGGKKGKLKKGYKYTGKKTKSGLPIIQKINNLIYKKINNFIKKGVKKMNNLIQQNGGGNCCNDTDTSCGNPRAHGHRRGHTVIGSCGGLFRPAILRHDSRPGDRAAGTRHCRPLDCGPLARCRCSSRASRLPQRSPSVIK